MVSIRQIEDYVQIGLVDNKTFNLIAKNREIFRDLDDIDLLVCVSLDGRFNNDQINEILDGIRVNNLSCEEIELYVNHHYRASQMRCLRYSIAYNIPHSCMRAFLDKRFNDLQLEEISDGLSNHLSYEQIMSYANYKFDNLQMMQIKIGLLHGVSIYNVLKYADTKFNYSQMEEIRLAIEDGLSDEQISIITKEWFDSSQMRQIRYGLCNGLTTDQVRSYARVDYSYLVMRDKRLSMQHLA